MNKQDLIAKIVRETRVSKRLASKMVAATLDSITKSLKKGDAVKVTLDSGKVTAVAATRS